MFLCVNFILNRAPNLTPNIYKNDASETFTSHDRQWKMMALKKKTKKKQTESFMIAFSAHLILLPFGCLGERFTWKRVAITAWMGREGGLAMRSRLCCEFLDLDGWAKMARHNMGLVVWVKLGKNARAIQMSWVWGEAVATQGPGSPIHIII